jgi:protein-S-isoprenylcysteine O-methyltransferase Ste14
MAEDASPSESKREESGAKMTQTLSLQEVQRWRKRLLAGALAGLALLASVSRADLTLPGQAHEALELCGFLLIALAIAGRVWSALYIAGRKKTELVESGPYSLSRNPLYLFTFLGTFGVGLQFGGVSFALLALLFTIAVFHLVVRREERFLEEAFGEAYRSYCRRTPRFWPRLSAWKAGHRGGVDRALVLRTFLDASLFLLAVPLFEAVEYLQESGFLPVLVHLV